MKRLAIVLVAVLGFGSITIAQDVDRTNRKAKAENMEQMKMDLDLSDEQVAQIKEIHEKYKPQLQEMRKQGEDMNSEAARELKTQQEKEVFAILTPEQQAKMKEQRAERREERRENGPNRDQGAE